MSRFVLLPLVAVLILAAPALAGDRDFAPSIPLLKPEIAIALPTPVIAPPPAHEKYWNHSWSESILSQYVWRGIRQRPNAGAVLQSNWSANHKRWTFSVWGSRELTGKNDATFFAGDKQQYKITEGDYTVDYAWAKGKYKFNTGLIYYRFPNSPFPSTQEFYQTVVFPGRLAPSFTIYQDIDENAGQFGLFGLTHTWDKFTLTAQAGYGSKKYNNFWFGVNKAAAAHSVVTLSYAHALSKTWTLTPAVSFYSILDKDLKKSGALSNKPNNFVGGLTFSRSF